MTHKSAMYFQYASVFSSLDVWTLKKFAMGFAFSAALLWAGSTWNTDWINFIKLTFPLNLPLKLYLMTLMGTWEASSGSLLLSWALGAALLANIPMMPFCGLLGGFETVSASPFMLGFLCSGSGSMWVSLARCSSREDMGVAPEQRTAA